MSTEKKENIDMHEIPRVEVYNDDEVDKRKNSLSTWVLVAILLLGGYYLWSVDNTSGNVVAEVTDAELNTQVDDILNQLEQEKATTENSVETDSGMIVKEFVEEDLVSFPYLSAKDPEGKSVSYTFSSPLNEKGEWQTKKGDAGEYLITVKASDGVDSAEQKVLVVVKKSTSNSLPVLELDKKEYYVKEGETLTILASAADADNDLLTITFEGWMDSNTRQVGYDEAGKHLVTVRASDGKVSVKEEVTVYVEDVSLKNEAPTIKHAETVEVTEGDLITLNPEITDVDSSELTVSYTGWMTSNTKQTSYEDAGSHEVTITASDGKDQTTKKITVIVKDVNRAPVFNSDAFK